MILKVQRPITTNDTNAPWLIYNYDRTVTVQMAAKDVPVSIKAAMPDEVYKKYFKATYSRGGIKFGAPLNRNPGW